jgi:hypothetical protein
LYALQVALQVVLDANEGVKTRLSDVER